MDQQDGQKRSSSIENTDTTSAGTLRTDINMSSSVSANTLSGQSAGTHALGSVTGGAGSSAAGTYTVTADGVVTSVNFTAGAGYAVTNTLTVQGSQGGGAGTFVITLKSSDLESKDAFVLKTISEGAITNNYQAGVDSANGTLDAGTRNNVRWEITGANTGSGQFSLSIRRGNDTATQKAVLEQYNNLSMDPTAANYVAKVIGNTYYTVEQDGVDYYVKSNGDYPNSSAYVFVGAVNSPTPQYFDNNGAAKSALLLKHTSYRIRFIPRWKWYKH